MRDFPLSRSCISKSNQHNTSNMDKEARKARENEIVDRVVNFSKQHIDEEYAALGEKMVRKLGRKRTYPLDRGRLEIWAASVVYTIGSMNFLFDKSFEPYLPTSEICRLFGVSQSTVAQKSAQIREMLKLSRYWDKDFSTHRMNDSNPFNALMTLDGYFLSKY